MERVFSTIVLILLMLVSQAQLSLSKDIPVTQVNRENYRDFVEYLSPLPNSEYHNINRQILIRPGFDFNIDALYENPELLSVVGSNSGQHIFDIQFSQDSRTMIIHPRIDFDLSETITITIDEFIEDMNEQTVPAFSFQFHTSSQLPASYRIEEYQTQIIEEENNLGDRVYPTISTLIDENPSSGNIFLHITGAQKYMAVLDSAASDGPLWYINSGLKGNDFKVNRNNKLSFFNRLDFYWLQMDEFAQEDDTMQMINGYLCDNHDFQRLEDEHYFMFAYDDQPIDMSEIVPGGDSNAMVEGFVIQEMDENDVLVFEWRSWDYLSITDNEHIDLTADDLNVFHINALEIDSDENIIISCRHTDEITKFDRQTGDLIWRWGNNDSNQFQFTNDQSFTYQHDIRRLDNGNLLLFDNGNFSQPQVSRVVEYSMNTELMTVTKVWEYIHPDELFGASMGCSQRLSNGNTFISWGNVNLDNYGVRVTEVDSDDNIVLEFVIDIPYSTYRARKIDWYFDASITGCTDPAADNFDPNAIAAGGNCIYDLDGDGFTSEEDCNDLDEDINPDAEEIPYDGIDQDCDGEDLIDVDGDGFSFEDDCDDTNADINPDAEEIPYDGIDQDCDDEDLTDVDGDGFSIEDDCDDNNEDINPDAEEIPNDGIDQDCDGEDLIVGVGELEEFGFAIFPIPTQDELKIYSSQQVEYKLVIMNSLGQTIIEKQVNDANLTLPLYRYSSGVYFLSIEFGNSKLMERIVIP